MSTYYASQYKAEREQDNPLDSVTQITFNPFKRGYNGFLAASWDGFIRYYELQIIGHEKVLNKKWEYFFQHPVLSCDITSEMLVLAGLANGQIVMVDMKDIDNVVVLGHHEAPICRVFWCEKYGIVLSLGYDCLFKCFNFQKVNNSFMKAQYKLPAKTMTVAFSFPYLLIGSNQAKICLLSLQRIQDISIPSNYLDIELSTASKLSCSSILAEEKRIALGTVDGLFIFTQFSSSNYHGFKIERPVIIKQQKRSNYHCVLMGQVNSVSICCRERKYVCCVYGGTEETGIYDLLKDKRAKTITTNSTITAVGVSPDSEYLVYGVGSDWLRGMQEMDGKKCRLIGMKISSSDFY